MSRAFDTAYNYIKENILTGVYLPSQKLIEVELSDVTNVSRNTIKKVLLTLEQENLVNLEKNKGAIVKSFNLQEVINYMEIRILLEGLIAGSAAEKISDQQLDQLQEILTEMSEHLEKKAYADYSACNRKFHDIVYTASGNKQAAEMARKIRVQLQRISGKTLAISDRPSSSYKEHVMIYEALKNRDGEKAKELIATHTSHVKNIIIDNYLLFT